MSSKREKLLQYIAAQNVGEVCLMEVCGTHTMSIARNGIKSMLPANIHLLSGPGCPVCVTPPQVIDAVLELSSRPDVTIASYGDMLRVPGSRPGDSLLQRRARGADVRIVYSPVDAVELAQAEPMREFVFLGAGFETTAPGTAAAVLTAKEQNVNNFSVFSMLKTVEPALRALTAAPDFRVQGFLCPGHVATIIGSEGFRFLADELGSPAVVSGFEGEEILLAIALLVKQIAEGKPQLQNAYPQAVAPNGNELAKNMILRCFAPRSDLWRGLGEIPASGLALKDELAGFDAEKKFGITVSAAQVHTACRCGDVITGRIAPGQCPLFGTRCTPEDPVGPCMVSSEGACAAAYKYGT
ncbi:MAG: hydrogenase formation protein HypD [Oscillospiraceae bacterium]|nr:hydrogenase formation protein HypD [Oscillospiraceae bacterium]